MNEINSLKDTIVSLLDIIRPTTAREQLEKKIKYIEETEKEKEKHPNKLDVYIENRHIEELKSKIELHKKLELIDSKFKSK